MTSDMPRVYIDRQGVDEFEVAREFQKVGDRDLAEQNERLRSEIAALKEALGKTTANLGVNGGLPLEPEVAR